jgi:transcriptional regulator with XRE-family HTH domain
MSDYRDEVIAKRLKALLDGRGITIKSAAERLDVPYRTLQNQLMGNNRMTASTLAKLLSLLELPVEAIIEGRVRPPLRPLASALKRVFGSLLPSLDEDMTPVAPGSDRTADELDRNARSLAFLLREQVERETIKPEDWATLLAADEDRRDVSN